MPLKLLPPPEPDEVVTALGQQLQIGIEVEPFRIFGAIVARTQPVMKVVVDMRAGEIDRPFRSVRGREIPGLSLETTSGPSGWSLGNPPRETPSRE